MDFHKKIFIFSLLIFLLQNSIAQNNNFRADSAKNYKSTKITHNESVRVVFYNVENLFDIYDDSLKNDDEFLPRGIRLWDEYKFRKKNNNIYKTLVAVGEWNAPGIIGLCEIENHFVLEKLISSTPLKNNNYKIIHYESPDYRGIDVALIYNPEIFQPLFSSPLQINFPFDKNLKTRDILYVKALIFNSDTLHLFVNHWSSRYGGLMKTKPKRAFVAKVLKQKTDSLILVSPQANILIMGDFNDNPDDESLQFLLKTSVKTNDNNSNDLVNLMENMKLENKYGSLKFKENWNVFDQIIVSEKMLDNLNGLKISNKKAKIFNAGFLLQKDEKYIGIKPFRTYSGYKYIGGFSDHLPVYIDLIKIRNK